LSTAIITVLPFWEEEGSRAGFLTNPCDMG
jgi:hypothetical protein